MLSVDGINRLEAENEHFKKMWKDTQKQLDIAGKAIVEMTEKNDKLRTENKELAARLKDAEKFTGLYDTCGKKICYGNIVHWTDGGDDLTLEQRIKERWDRIAVVGKYMTNDNIIRPEICFNVIDSPSERTREAAAQFEYGCFIYKDTETNTKRNSKTLANVWPMFWR